MTDLANWPDENLRQALSEYAGEYDLERLSEILHELRCRSGENADVLGEVTHLLWLEPGSDEETEALEALARPKEPEPPSERSAMTKTLFGFAVVFLLAGWIGTSLGGRELQFYALLALVLGGIFLGAGFLWWLNPPEELIDMVTDPVAWTAGGLAEEFGPRGHYPGPQLKRRRRKRPPIKTQREPEA